ncbi:MAG: NTP transferase domain-containing protein [Candidatus Brennerbacteria bacterium]|nr:NTP transferase domain-containing protein [Candidatus Brennerbacteria bacterium]
MAHVTRITQAVILAGGAGTRLKPLTDHTPKPMILMNGKPFLEYLIKQLKENGIEEVLLLLGYLPEKTIAHFGDGAKFGVRIKYSVTPVEDSIGTRIRKAADLMEDYFILLNCDNFWPLRIEELVKFHNKMNSLITTVVYTNKNGITKNNVLVDDEGYIVRFDPSRTDPDLNGVNLVYAITSKEVIGLMPTGDFDYEKVMFPMLIAQRKLAGYRSDERHHSIGSLERLPGTEQFLKTLDEKNKNESNLS